MKFQGEMKAQRKKQKTVNRHCSQMLVDAERAAERESISLIESYKKEEKHAYRKIERERAETSERPIPGHEEIEGDLDQKIGDL